MYHIPLLKARVSEDVPTESPLYSCLRSVEPSIRPFSSEHLRKRQSSRNENEVCSLPTSFDRKLPRSFLYGEVYGGIWGTNSESVSALAISARTNSILEGQEGRLRPGGIGVFAEPRLTGSFAKWNAFEVTPRISLLWSSEGTAGDVDADVFRAYAKLGHGAFEVTLGRFSEIWGHGRSGGLLLGQEHRPLLGGRIRNAFPIELPFFLRHLGPTQFSLVIARLDGQQVFPHSILAAHRLTIQPWKWLGLGVSQATLFGGDGSPEISVGDAILEFFGNRKGDIFQSNFSNKNFLFDLSITPSFFPQLKVYSEFYLEDCCGGPALRDLSNLVGATLTRGKYRFTLEGVRTTEITYRNVTFTSGFEDRGRLLGHLVGPDGLGLYIYLDFFASPTLFHTWELAFEKRGRSQETQLGANIRTEVPSFESPEERARSLWKSTWYPLGLSHPLWIRASVGFEHVHDFAFRRNNSKNFGMGMIESGFRF